ncbi:polyprenyl synthetase family protein [Bacillus benzoevorans]|nr:polyprenyl synthetase family protein [Bacillus benzoevorans]
MNNELIKNEDECYRLAEQKAAHYFKLLREQVTAKTYVTNLTKDFQSWKQNHIHHSFLSFFSKRQETPDLNGYHSYIQWLELTGKLDHYLDRSVSYIFMRDLGKALDSAENKESVRRFTAGLKKYLLKPASESGEQIEMFSMDGMYRWGQKEGIESAVMWMHNKIQTAASHIPKGMDAEHAKRKLMKIIGGVLIHEMEAMGGGVRGEERTKRLDHAIRLGYSYGLTYPFIDDLLDSAVLSDKEKRQYSDLIRRTLITGVVPELGKWTGENRGLIQFIHAELREAFEYIRANQRRETIQSFFELAYVFFQSQENDREKNLANAHYTNEELYIPVILKSSSSRLIVRSVIGAPEDKGFENRTFYYGIYNQLADDFADMFDDLRSGAVTPYTYFLTYHEQRPDLINPFQLYWSVISYLIHDVYGSDPKTCEVILDRAINSLKRFKLRVGKKKYHELMGLFTSEVPTFNQTIQHLVRKADDVDFFDKLLRDHVLTVLKKEQQEREEFIYTINTVRNQINETLPIAKNGNELLLKSPIIDAANYSLEGDGKRLRPIITWMMGINEYGLDRLAIMPMLRALEYMHTASLIFDDLPSQDNAPIRRGRQTVHQMFDAASAELTGLFLTQKAVHELSSLEGFEPRAVLRLIQYASQVTMDMCMGQAMDLHSKGKQLSLEELNTMCFYKTGIAFEASLIMPAIVAHADEAEMKALKKFARHAGIAFQIKDDLLDVEGDKNLLGKPVGKDAENNNSTFVSVLGLEGAKKAMWDHYCTAMETLQEVPRNTTFLKYLLDYLVNRER